MRILASLLLAAPANALAQQTPQAQQAQQPQPTQPQPAPGDVAFAGTAWGDAPAAVEGKLQAAGFTSLGGADQDVPVYRGDWFVFSGGAEALRRAKRTYVLLSLLCAFLFAGVLLLNAPSGRFAFAMLPFSAMVFPVFFSLAGSLRLIASGARVTREGRDKMQGRFVACALSMSVLSAVSAVGHTVYWRLHGGTPKDIASLAATLVILASAIAMLSLREGLDMEKTA
jgi:hypothetical protein